MNYLLDNKVKQILDPDILIHMKEHETILY